jgi:hypothetical protein
LTTARAVYGGHWGSCIGRCKLQGGRPPLQRRRFLLVFADSLPRV